MLAVQIYQDVFQLFNFSSTMAFILMAAAIAVILPIQWIERRRADPVLKCLRMVRPSRSIRRDRSVFGEPHAPYRRLIESFTALKYLFLF